MGLFQYVKNIGTGIRLGHTFSRGKAISSSSSSDWYGFFNRRAHKQTFDTLTTKQQLQAIQNNALVFACVTTLASAFQEAPLIVETKKEGAWVSNEEHRLLDPFKKNPFLSESDIMTYIIMHLETTGKAFLWKWYNGAKQVNELWPVPPHWVKIVPVEDPKSIDNRVVLKYEITPPGMEMMEVSPNDIIYMRFPDPCTLWDSLSPIKACSPYLQLETKSLEFKGKTLDSLKVPGIVVKTPAPLTTDQKRDLRATLGAKLGSTFSADDAITLSGKDAQLDLLNPASGLDLKEFSELDESRICMVFRVPPVVIGALVGIENSPWSNVGEAKSWLYKNTIFGLWKMVQTGLNRALIPENQRGVIRYAYDLSEVKELQENIQEVEKRANELYGNGVITRSEAREMIHFAPMLGDDVYKSRLNETLIPAGEEFTDLNNDGVISSDEHMTDNDVL